MTDLYEIYVRLFIISPLLLYSGYSIMRNKSHISSMLFHVVVILSVAMVLFFHLKYIIKVLRRILRNEKYQKEFGFFLIGLALFTMFLCIYDLIYNKK